jgi:prepilin-type N-terminal cleavage/methylation domain-containing protein
MKSSKGFTLLELLISITILAMIVTIISSVLRLGFRTWNYDEKHTGQRDAVRAVEQLVLSQLRSAYPINKTGYYFHGTSNEISFVTTLSMHNETTGLYWVSYRMVEDPKDPGSYQFMVREGIVGSIDPDRDPDVGFTPVLNKIASFHLAYLKAPVAGQEAEWEESWNIETPRPVLPDAVKVEVVFQKQSRSLNMIAPIYCSGILTRMLEGL